MQRAAKWALYRDKRRKIPQGPVVCNPVSCMQALLDRWVVADHHTHRCDSRKNLCPLDTETDSGGHADDHNDGDQAVGVPITCHASSIGVISALKTAESGRHYPGRDGTALHPPLYLPVCNRDQRDVLEQAPQPFQTPTQPHSGRIKSNRFFRVCACMGDTARSLLTAVSWGVRVVSPESGRCSLLEHAISRTRQGWCTSTYWLLTLKTD